MNKRKFKLFLPALAGILLFIFLASSVNIPVFANEASPSAATSLGSITVCKVVVGEDGNIVDGSASPGTTFSISGINPSPNSGGASVGVIGTSVFTSPLIFNKDIFASFLGNDAQCTTYSGLAIGAYYYGEESIVPASGWEEPKYNDQFTTPVVTLSDFFAYDNNLFDGNTLNDDLRNRNADGHIVLNDQRPDRTLIVLNQFEEDGANTGDPSPSPSPTPSPTPGPSTQPSPTSAPSPSTGGSGNTNSNSSGGGTVLGTSTGPQVLAATGSSNSFALAISGFGMIGAGIWQLKRVKGLGSR
ncbi:MAG: hypothetical protein AAB512_04265 [Patescibacteria group bacterium]